VGDIRGREVYPRPFLGGRKRFQSREARVTNEKKDDTVGDDSNTSLIIMAGKANFSHANPETAAVNWR